MAGVSFSDDKFPQFFKVFIPKFSSNHMLIPPAFVGRFISRVPKRVVIKDNSGKCWVVALVTVEKDLYFENGWEMFVRDQLLKFGDFLVFRYHGNSLFEVEIFGGDGCKKEIVVASPQVKVMVKEEEDTLKKKVPSSHAYNHAHIEEIGLDGSTKKSSSPTKHGQLKKNPCFVVTLEHSKCQVFMICIPQSVHKGVKFEPDMKLQYHNSKLWPVKISTWKDGRCFISSGWKKFRQENDLKANDKCKFELVLGEGNVCKEIKVTCQSKVQ
ncbi:putative B3 domain-containing protein At5g66980 [Humulus lupulus]|uniref:putative B3 domain-containing protein At5g66980 n=1 Tax=Humulus lupulus TaxID=3486 RepID=UPI002B414214|nr:putative B3 domain-containing protein At5g66980 [Humulus lupulus]XP_062118063.1 putative B3 domain-containing protein At5g66980 [Humulus lupulus]